MTVAPGARRGSVDVNGVRIYYAERGRGPAVVFVHMGGTDYRYWDAQLPEFADRGYRAFAYSRRFAHPNHNPMISDYSPLVDANDLALLVAACELAPAHVVASSIGACGALFLAAARPELVRSLVLAEPPMLEWARDTPGGPERLAAFFRDVWHPAGAAFARADAAGALRVLMEYFVGPGAFDVFPAGLRSRMLQNARDWEAHTTSSNPFPALERAAVREITAPTLLLSGGATLPIHRIVDAELEALLPRCRRVVLPGASHDVWGDAGPECRARTLEFLDSIRDA